MDRYRNFAFLALIALAIVLPTALALGWFVLSDDPGMRPLGVTKQALRAFADLRAGVEIVAVVDWAPAHSGHYTQAQLERALQEAFQIKGVDVRVVFRTGATITQVTYEVGKTVLGPYSTSRASEGVAAAVEAYRMHD